MGCSVDRPPQLEREKSNQPENTWLGISLLDSICECLTNDNFIMSILSKLVEIFDYLDLRSSYLETLLSSQSRNLDAGSIKI